MTGKNSSVRSGQFEGCLLGVLVGDCLGYPYENEVSHSITTWKIQEFFDQLLEEKGKSDFQYTDDSSMTKTLAKFIINSNDFDPKVLAQKFTEGYNTEKRERCYGSHVPKVFSTLLKINYEDPFKPSHAQFEGQGSFGNGAGMRVAPLAMMTIQDEDTTNLIDVTIKTSRITHGHPLGIIGGIFQALAVRQALLFGADRINEKNQHSRIDILNAFEKDFDKISPQQFPFATEQTVQDALKIYKEKIKSIKSLLEEGNRNVSFEKVKRLLGVKVTAADSIPTALYSFLVAFEDIFENDKPLIKADNQFQRTIQFAISCGGDTDTIASMAGAIVGGYLGNEAISMQLIKHCEDYANFETLGKSLYKRYKTITQS